MIIDEFEKNAMEVVRTVLSDFQGNKYLNIRVWYKPDDGGPPRPTRKGIALHVEQLPELKRAVLKAEKALEKGQAAESIGTPQ